MLFVDKRLLARYRGGQISRRLKKYSCLLWRDDHVGSMASISGDNPPSLEQPELLAGRARRHM